MVKLTSTRFLRSLFLSTSSNFPDILCNVLATSKASVWKLISSGSFDISLGVLIKLLTAVTNPGESEDLALATGTLAPSL